MIWLLLLIPIYVVGWFTSAMIFTRWFPTRSCAYGCTRVEYRYGNSFGNHAALCKKWRNEPCRPDDAMAYALIWPLWWLRTPVYSLLHWNHTRDPWTKSRRRAIRGLSDKELAQLDAVLFDNKELTS
jgi:hypothetical protein